MAIRKRFKKIDANKHQSVRDAALVSKRILEEANVEAEAIVQRAIKKSETIKHEAHAVGKRKGREEALRHIFDISRHRQQMLSESNSAILDVVIAVTEEVLGAALKIQPESIVKRVARALKYCVPAQAIQVCVSPRELSYVKKMESQLRANFSKSVQIEINEDPQISDGNAVVQSGRCTIECSTQEHLSALATYLAQGAAISAYTARAIKNRRNPRTEDG